MQEISVEVRVTVLFQAGFAQPGKVHELVSKECKVSLRTVQRIVSKLKKGQSTSKKQYQRDPTIFTEEVCSKIIEYFQEYSRVKHILSVEEIKNELEIKASSRQLRNVLNLLGINYKRINRVPLMTGNHEERRVQFAQNHLHDDWSNILFVDESTIWTHACPNFSWQFKGENHTEMVPKNVQKVHLNGGISLSGATELFIFEDNLTGQGYADIIENFLVLEADDIFGESDWMLCQDRDPKHTSKVAQNKYTELGIENIWGIVKEQLSKHQPKTKDDIKRIVVELWDNLSLELITKIINSMPTRLQQVIQSNGKKINY